MPTPHFKDYQKLRTGQHNTLGHQHNTSAMTLLKQPRQQPKKVTSVKYVKPLALKNKLHNRTMIGVHDQGT